MPDTSQTRPLQPPAGRLHSNTTLRLIHARTTSHITQAEFQQYRDWYIGLIMLNHRTDNLITRRLWAGVRLPLGFILCTDGKWRDISTIARYGKRNPRRIET